MRVAIASVQVPFVRGGAELMTEGLYRALIEAGHEASVITLPFRFSPPSAVISSIEEWQKQDFEALDIGQVDRVVALKFPSYNLKHSNKIVWLMHQHRSVYELLDSQYGESSYDAEAMKLRDKVIATDNMALNKARAVFTISQTVSNRMLNNNHIASTALYQPPPMEMAYKSGPIFPYIFCPSRLEDLKRQDLLIHAMRLVKEPVMAIVSGEGGSFHKYYNLVRSLGLEKRVYFVGRVDREVMINYYSNALAVYFGPYDEDYGFITLEAMLSAKPVITCVDSGGPTEFVRDQETGFILNPDPESIAEAINELWGNKNKAVQMGENGCQRYKDLGISWNNVVDVLLGA